MATRTGALRQTRAIGLANGARGNMVADPEMSGGEPMADFMILQLGEEPNDARNFVLVEPIPAPRGAPRYRGSPRA